MEIIIIIILILLNGLFSMSEMAVVSSKKFKLELEKKKVILEPKKHLTLLKIQINSFQQYKLVSL